MGLLVNGKWQDKWYDTKSTGGRFVRHDSQFRQWISPNGKEIINNHETLPAEKNRYHLYVSLACPWASRVMIVRALKGLEEILPVSIVSPYMLDQGWSFDNYPGVIADPVIKAKYLHQIYTLSTPTYSGRVTVPVLLDKKTNKIVNNESSDIIRMLNTGFDNLGAKNGHFYPQELQAEIDQWNDIIYDHINNGVYKAGFATEQAVYEEEVQAVFETLDQLENHLSQSEYLVDHQLTEADIRLFVTLVRFDSVYFGHFKCNLRPLTSYPNLWNYTKRIYHLPGIKETINFDHIKTHYYGSHPTINPNGIIPSGPILDWDL